MRKKACESCTKNRRWNRRR